LIVSRYMLQKDRIRCQRNQAQEHFSLNLAYNMSQVKPLFGIMDSSDPVLCDPLAAFDDYKKIII